MILGFVAGLLLGIHLGYWAWALHVWAKQTLHYLAEIRRHSAREPSVVKAQVIQPINGQGTSPNVVKPKTPRQINLDKLAELRSKGL